jgi:hypothetical protein
MQAVAVEILRCLIERVALHPAENGFEIELIGKITTMVELGTQDKAGAPKGAAVTEAYRRSDKVVAGARNHLYRTTVWWSERPKPQRFGLAN